MKHSSSPSLNNCQISDENWLRFINLIQKAIIERQAMPLFQLIMTPDEWEAFGTRLCIIEELINGDLSQREMKNVLGVGIATITRGSNSLKDAPPTLKKWLKIHLRCDELSPVKKDGSKAAKSH